MRDDNERQNNHGQGLVFIAEVSANHLGRLDRAFRLADAAKAAGADFLKLQHFRPDTITVRGNHPDLHISGGTLWDGRDLWSLYEEAMMPWGWTAEIDDYCKEIGLKWISTPFDETAVDFLEGFDVPMYKIASFEIVDLPLIRRVAQTGKAIIISTGMATVEEIDAAVEAARAGGATDITLLRTNSAYPASPKEMDLMAIPFMQSRWGLPVGLSDHTLGSTSAIVAAALGATVFEKHLTVLRSDGGPDAGFSTEPAELAEYVRVVNEAHGSLGSARFGPSERELSSLAFRPSLRAVRPIRRGEKISAANVKSVRPAGGLPPEKFLAIDGKIAKSDIAQGDPILGDVIEGGPS